MQSEPILVNKKYNQLFSEKILDDGLNLFHNYEIIILYNSLNTFHYKVLIDEGYYVSISQYEDTNSDIQMSCSCNYPVNCKHIAAAFFKAIEVGNITTNKFPSSCMLNNFKEDELIIDLSESYRGYIQKPKNGKLKGTYKLFFSLFFDESFESTERFLKVKPIGRMIKKNGKLGKVIEYISIYEKIQSEVNEKKVHHIIYNKNNNCRLIEIISEFNNKNGIKLYSNFLNKHLAIEVYEIKRVVIDFYPNSLDSEPELGVLIHVYIDKLLSSLFTDQFYFECNGNILIIYDSNSNKLYTFKSNSTNLFLIEDLVKKSGRITINDYEFKYKYMSNENVYLNFNLGKINIKRIRPKPVFKIYGDSQTTIISIFMDYQDNRINFYSNITHIPDKSGYAMNNSVFFSRDSYLEKEILQKFDFLQTGYEEDDSILLFMNMSDFLSLYYNYIIDNDGEIYIKRDLDFKPLIKGKISLELSSDIDWLDFKIMLNGGSLNIQNLNNVLIEQIDSYLLLNKEKLELLKRVLEEHYSKNRLRISKNNLYLLKNISDNFDVDLPQTIEKRIKAFNRKKYEVCNKTPDLFSSVLRDYQLFGYNWILFHYEIKLGAILADDMGLGKTVQTLAALLNISSKGKKKAYLIVAPVSVIANWKSEIWSFTPSLEAHVYSGSKRIEWNRNNHDIIITSYQTLNRDLDKFQNEKWDVIILDEAQALKNSQTVTYKSVKKLNSDLILALSGTPIENRISELWSIYSIVIPGLLGTKKSFISKYRKPLEVGNKRVISELRKTIEPFFLRRTKEQVASELPNKEIVMLKIELSEEEITFYNKKRMEYISEIIKMKNEKSDKFKILSAVINALNNLRQIAIAPQLKGGPNKSSKIDIVIKRIIEASEEGHKVLVFSQYVRVLNLIKEQLSKSGIQNKMLTGAMSQKKRNDAIASFKNSKDCYAFLISIKAGGSGLNLVESDYVIIVDPWWNPAVENQAIDRVHRIGQTKPVIAYKIISANSVEEKILELQDQKRELVDSIMKDPIGEKSKFDIDEMIKLL